MPSTNSLDNLPEVRLKILENIRESLLDITYSDEMSDDEATQVVQQMTSVSEYILELLGVEIQRENENGSISVLIHLQKPE